MDGRAPTTRRGAAAIAPVGTDNAFAEIRQRLRILAWAPQSAKVEQILMVASEDRHAEVWRRAEDGWNVQDLIGDAAIPLAIDGQPLPLAAICDGVAF
jgi:hypothetical protein